MRTSRVAAGVIAAGMLVAVSGCGSSDGSKTDELRQFLTDHHQYDMGFDGLGTVTVKDGNVTVDTARAWADPSYGSYMYCAWVEDWLRGEGHGAADSQIVVMMGGRETLRSRGESESCAEAG